MWLYQHKLIKLEEGFENARAIIGKLQEDLENGSEGDMESDRAFDKAKVKFKLDMAVALIRLLKEQMNFYLKLCEDYDAVRLIEDLIDELGERNASLCEEILLAIDSRWGTDFQHSSQS